MLHLSFLSLNCFNVIVLHMKYYVYGENIPAQTNSKHKNILQIKRLFIPKIYLFIRKIVDEIRLYVLKSRKLRCPKGLSVREKISIMNII
ncbi:hypothetical protein RSA42_13530 [Exiguobacterium indicum]|nr:hypothetical protein RSA42_13530 [Exiguobacterium indicum]